MTSLLSALAMVIMAILPESQSEPCPFNPLCTCRRSHHEVTCRSVPFSALPVLPLDDLYQVTIVRSGLEVLHNDSLHGTSVASLHLMHNNLVVLLPKAFNGVELLLTTLDLSHNHLHDFPLGALRRLHFLQWLNLYSNELDDVAGWRWGHLISRTSLQSLFLGGNHITLIPEGAFLKLSNLTALDLEGNIIYEVDGRSLPMSLRSLTLSNNLLKKVPLHALYSLKNLRWLHLAGNLFQRLPKPLVLQVPFLEKLDFSNNILVNLPEGVFNGSMAIKDLHLEFNFLRTMSARVYKGTRLDRLFLANNRISTVHSDALVGLETTLTVLDLSFNLLETFPTALKDLSSLLHLSLRGNLLEELDRHDLNGYKDTLEVLDLSGNRLKHVPKKPLQSLRRLARLSLQDNCINKVYRDDFEGWGGSLMTLSLANNKMTYLSGGTFLHTPKLRELRLSFNNLMYLDQYVFAPVRKTLEVLELSASLSQYNHPPEMFLRDLSRLEWLQMDHNNISTLSTSCFNSLSRLLHFDIEGNDIEELPEDMFSSGTHPRLSSIFLSNNAIQRVQSKAFDSLLHASNIVLFGNRITTIETGSFVHCPYLHTLVLAHNFISVIQPTAFANLTRLSNVFLQENLLTEFSLDVFLGETSHLYVNLSNNFLQSLEPSSENSTMDYYSLKIRTIDLSHNQITFVPKVFVELIAYHLLHLFLSYNQISNLSTIIVPRLQVLHLSNNKVGDLASLMFGGTPSLQILVLDNNNITEIAEEAFANMGKLRILDLSYNRISLLPENAFVGTKLERVNLSHNNIVRPPFHSLVSVRETLRYLDLSLNRIETIPTVDLSDMSNLQALNLSSNMISFLDDDCFKNLKLLLELDLSNNPIWRIDENPLRPLVALKSLYLGNTSLASLPVLPLSRLRILRLSANFLYNISHHALADIHQLRDLDLSWNYLQDVPVHLWRHVPGLVTLDLSHNPIEVLGVNSFAGLSKLRHLDIRGLQLRRLDPRTLHGLRYLTTFKTDTYSAVRSFRLHDLLSQATALSRVTVQVEEPTLSHQLQGAFGTKLRELTVTGRNLQRIFPDAFVGLSTHELIIRITGTSVTRFPDGLLRYLPDVRYLTLDLRDNQLTSLGPEVLAAVSREGTDSEATQHITGGVLLEDNPWNCSCEILWLGQWLRRWMRETFHVHMLSVEAALYVHSIARKAVCSIPGTNSTFSIIDIKASDFGCHNANNKASAIGMELLVVLLVAGASVTIVPWIIVKR